MEEYWDREVLMSGEYLNKQGAKVGIRRGGDTSAMVTP